MAESMDNVVFKVKKGKEYSKMFLAAFGDKKLAASAFYHHYHNSSLTSFRIIQNMIW